MCDVSAYSGSAFLYYTHIPIIAIMLLMGFLILFSDIKNKININYFFIILSLIVWILADFLSWNAIDQRIVLLSERIATIGLLGIALIAVFFYIFPEGRKISYKILSLIFSPLLIFSIFVPTKLYMIDVTPAPNCDPVTGPVFNFIFLLLFYYIIICIWFVVGKYKKVSSDHKKQLKIFIWGTILLVCLAVILNIIPTIYSDAAILTLFTPLSGLVFAAFCAYAIVKYRAMNVKVVAAQIFTILICIFIASQFFFIQNDISLILTGVTLLFSMIFGYILIKSVNREVSQKEKLQKITTKLERANAELKKLDTAKTEFISIASHQLRTPITAIKGFSSLVLEGAYGETNEGVHGAMEKIFVSSQRLVDLIEDLLDVSRIESGRMQFNFAAADVEKILKELYDSFILIAKNKKFYLDYKPSKTPLPEIVMDAGKVRELVSNFIDNALKYTEKGGVTIYAELRNAGRVVDESGFVIEDEKSKFGPVVRITVSDTGIGIPEDEIPFLFKKFSRGKDVSRLHVGGTGLGLFVGKAIAEAHHGQVWVESDGAGRGSRFIIEIPVNRIE